MSLTNDQYQLLDRINRYSESSRRTDRLAVCMKLAPCEGPGWSNSHVPFIGLQLRDRGYATTHKDTQQYARWDITPVGKAALLEETARRTPKAAPPPPVFEYAVFDAADSSFNRFTTLLDAQTAAKKYAIESEGTKVYVLQVLKTLTAKVVVEEV